MSRIRLVTSIALLAGICLGSANLLAGNESAYDGTDDGNSMGSERIKDLANIAGVRDNQLVGYGLVVGLNGTGDQTTQAPFTVQSLKNMLGQLGVTIPPNVNPQLKNVAAVMITADLAPFAKPGQRMDITVSSLGNAKSLRGGTLLMTPMKGADGQVYAMAQGNLTVGGFGVGGDDGSSITVNVPSVGRIPNGATVEREVPSSFGQGDSLVLNLKRQDFTTANRMSEVINERFGGDVAQPLDGSSVQVRAPTDMGQRVAFVSMLENLSVATGDPPARVVINARTGTIVIGSGVKVTPAAVSHGNLTVTISENPQVSQPGAFAGGQTAIVPQTDIAVEQDKNRMFLFAPGTSLGEIVQAVNDVGAAPGDLVAILEALREAGALRADLVVI
ncbi:flagellar basal body P-ring protein FlgI [Thiocystis violascens]|uniref:Flagellar P-ring protein n=1 Tax=Thiocystis violascens (strain ATCC 17096 / DSM 198 / 6111) TaxID=765911 RepID=I3Y653_THIV6|nr:flagellar basal body P-ring protein FlgI [Thiocystis violascens]AFL72471.1 flagellar basal-body P-ring protein [Thiocystis violascens DSM 198]